MILHLEPQDINDDRQYSDYKGQINPEHMKLPVRHPKDAYIPLDDILCELCGMSWTPTIEEMDKIISASNEVQKNLNQIEKERAFNPYGVQED